MEFLAGLLAFWMFFRWVLPILLLVLVAYFAYRWASSERGEFKSTEPRDREKKN